MPDFEPLTTNISRLQVSFGLGPLRIPVAVWLIRDGESYVLVDSGVGVTSDEVVAAVARATSGRGVRMVLLTHAHPDHGGGLSALRSAWNPPILCHRDEVAFVTGERRYRDLQPQTIAYWFGRYLHSGTGWELPVARDLERGQSVVGMVVIHLPGHSPGQIGFLHPEDGAMICGDAVMNFRGRLRRPHPLFTFDPEQAQASIARLGELDFDHLLPSHGPPIMDGGRQAVSRLLSTTRHRQDEIS